MFQTIKFACCRYHVGSSRGGRGWELLMKLSEKSSRSHLGKDLEVNRRDGIPRRVPVSSPKISNIPYLNTRLNSIEIQGA